MFCDMFVVHLDLALVHLRFAFLAEHMKLRCVNQKKCQNFTIHLWFTNQHVKIYNHLYIYIYIILQLYIIPEKVQAPRKIPEKYPPRERISTKKIEGYLLYISFPQLEFNWISSFPSFFFVPHPKSLAENPQRFPASSWDRTTSRCCPRKTSWA